MSRRTYGASAAELDRQDALIAMRQPPKPAAQSAGAKVIAALRSKLDKQRNEIGRLTRDNQALRDEKALLLLDLSKERAAHERLRALARRPAQTTMTERDR